MIDTTNKKPKRALSEINLEKVSEILRNRWEETQRAMQLRIKEKDFHRDFN
jgi:hypothetical protein